MIMLDWMIYTNQQFDLFFKKFKELARLHVSKGDDNLDFNR